MNKPQDQPSFTGWVVPAPSQAIPPQHNSSGECVNYLITHEETTHRFAVEERRRHLLNPATQQMYATAPLAPYQPVQVIMAPHTQSQAMVGPLFSYNAPPPYYVQTYAPMHSAIPPAPIPPAIPPAHIPPAHMHPAPMPSGPNYAPPGIILPRCLQPAATSAPVTSSQPTLPPSIGLQVSGGPGSNHSTSTTKPRSFRKGRDDFTSLWGRRYNELIEFKKVHGHCNVPQRYPPNVELGRWVKDQRTFKTKGKLSQNRTDLLEAIDFSWRLKCNDSFWDKQLKDLVAYKKKYGSYNVSMSGSQHIQLARWVDRQRRAKKSGKLNGKRMEQLDSIGFNWSTR